jgi:hypothetical protein
MHPDQTIALAEQHRAELLAYSGNRPRRRNRTDRRPSLRSWISRSR